MKLRTSSIEIRNDFEGFVPRVKEALKALDMDEAAKNFVLDQAFMDSNSRYYQCYPYLFCEVFPTIDEQELTSLSVAGFLYYKSLIFLDELVDTSRSVDPKQFFLWNICQEESIKILSSHFTLTSQFWKSWNLRRHEYIMAISLEKRGISDFDQFERLADFKSSFGKVALDSLYTLSSINSDISYEELLRSHSLFSAGVQLVDDILDLREDIENDQFSFALHLLKAKLPERGLDPKQFASVDLIKLFYIFGLAEQLFEKSLNYLSEAAVIASKHGSRIWLSVINQHYNEVLMKKLDATAFLEQTRSLTKGRVATDEVASPIELATRYLERIQKANGCWTGFYNGAGLSDVWVTAYTVCNLSNDLLKHHINEKVISKALDFLKNKNGELWGYNKSWIADADSSTFALWAHFLNGLDTNNLQFWLKYQSKSGGFVTYNNESQLRISIDTLDKEVSLEGWLMPHVCVSAAAYYFLVSLNQKGACMEKLENYLIKNVGANGLWESYWWTSPIYGTSFLIKSLLHCKNDLLKGKIRQSIPALMKLQNEDGSFGDQHERSIPFYTSLVIDAFCQEQELYHLAKENIDRAVDWLLSHQNECGDWEGASVMRMPSPEILDPEEVEHWPIGTRGTNIRVSDFNGLFTTSTAVRALVQYNHVK